MTKNAPPTVEKVNQIAQRAADMRVAHLVAEDSYINGRTITIDRKRLINFGNCSYLGLEIDPRIKAAAIHAIQKFGIQYSSSRAYVCINLFDTLEDHLSQIFEKPTIVAPTTTLGHMSNIPTLVSNRDAIILDHQVHTSVQNSVAITKASGTHVEMVRHNNMESLEYRIEKLSKTHRKVWYMADGIYSMFGDGAPLKKLYQLLEKHDQFHLYVDDAHGMSWTGRNGRGFVLDQIPFHPKMYLITSLAKGFGACGSAMVFPDQQSRNLVRNCGGTLMFSGPVQPATMGAAIASAKIHLSDEINDLQAGLSAKIQYFLDVAKSLDLPLVGDFHTPIFFIGVGNPDVGYNVCQRLISRGFYSNLAVFPSVPYYNTGLRFTLSNHIRFEDISNMLMALAEELEGAIFENNYCKQKIFKAFARSGFFSEKLKENVLVVE